MRLVLGSASPRRLELLALIGVAPDRVCPADIDETPHRAEDPRRYCARMARQKAEALVASGAIAAGEVVLTADTTVAVGRRILGKPESEDEARAFLTLLSGRRHRVITAVAVAANGRVRVRDVVTAVRLKRLSREETDAYLASGEWRGKAGGYAIQGLASAFIPWISGSFTAVVGLPLAETAGLLRAAGYPVWGAAPGEGRARLASGGARASEDVGTQDGAAAGATDAPRAADAGDRA